MADISLILCKGDKAYDVSRLVENIKWKGRKGSAARSLGVTLIDTDKVQSGIDASRGDRLVFLLDKKELFRGIIMSQQRSDASKMTVTAYDNGIYLANNKDTFVYKNKTLHDIFIDVCKRFDVKYSNAAPTSYKISELTKPQTTAWDVMLDAVSQDFKATGTKYYISSSKGVLSLLKRRENIIQWVLDDSANLISYGYKKASKI